MLFGEILPFHQHVFNIVAAIRRGSVFIRSPQPDMLELKHRFQFVPIFSADVADTFHVGLTLAYGEKMFYFVSAEQLSDVFVKMRSVQHFVCGKIFGNKIQHVAAESVYAEICPEIHDVATLLPHFRIFPVQIGLLHGERVKIIFVRRGVVFPCAAAETCRPGGERFIRPDIIIVIGVVFRRAGLFKPVVFGRGVIHHEIHDDFDAVFMEFFRKFFPVVQRSEFVHDIAVIRDIVAVVVIRAFIAGADPHGAYAQFFQIGDFFSDSVQIADPVTVRVVKTARVNLIHLPIEIIVFCFFHFFTLNDRFRRRFASRGIHGLSAFLLL